MLCEAPQSTLLHHMSTIIHSHTQQPMFSMFTSSALISYLHCNTHKSVHVPPQAAEMQSARLSARVLGHRLACPHWYALHSGCSWTLAFTELPVADPGDVSHTCPASNWAQSVALGPIIGTRFDKCFLSLCFVKGWGLPDGEFYTRYLAWTACWARKVVLTMDWCFLLDLAVNVRVGLIVMVCAVLNDLWVSNEEKWRKKDVHIRCKPIQRSITPLAPEALWNLRECGAPMSCRWWVCLGTTVLDSCGSQQTAGKRAIDRCTPSSNRLATYIQSSSRRGIDDKLEHAAIKN